MMYYVVVVLVNHRYNDAVLGHRTGPNNSGVEDYLINRRNTKQKTGR